MLAVFDQSSAHNAFSPDALVAKRMNVGPKGNQPIMHDTTFPDDCPIVELRGKPQTMVYPANHPDTDLAGKPKGMAAVLEERGLWPRLVAAATSPGRRVLGRCAVCKASVAKRAKLEAEAQARLAADPDLFGSLSESECLLIMDITQYLL